MMGTKDCKEEKVYEWISADYAGLPGKVKTGGGKMEDKNQGREREGKKTEKLMEVERLKD